MDTSDVAGIASKKRVAERQLIRNDNFDAEDKDVCGHETESFQRASEEVLSTRKIVKVHRSQSSVSKEGPNPFAALKLFPPTSVPKNEEPCKVTDEFSIQSEGTVDKETIEVGEFAVEEADEKDHFGTGLIDLNSTGIDTEELNEEVLKGESADTKHIEASAEETRIGDPDNEQTKKEEEEEGEEKSNKKTFERKQPAAVKTFQQLSTAQNAFSGLSGTGFSSSSFSFDTKIMPFGSTPKFGSFNIGSACGSPSSTACLFGTKLGSDDLSPSAASGSTTASSAPLQFGAPATDNISRSGSTFGTLQEVPVETGEEKEKAVFTADAALFQYLNGGWKERGKGELRLNIPASDTGRARLVMRARGNYRLILNSNLYPDMKLTGMEKRGFSFACVNSAGETKEGLATFALKFKDSSIAEDFQSSIEAHKGRSLAELKEKENLPLSGQNSQIPNEASES